MSFKRQPENRQPIEAGTLPDALLKLATVEAMTGLSRPSIYRRLALGLFPQPVRLGRRCTRWPANSVREWIREQAREAAA